MSSHTTPTAPLWIAGLSTRTTNAVAQQTIPALWARYMSDVGCKQAQAASGAAADAAIYAVYCDFDRSNPGEGDIMTLGYRLVIGVPVSGQPPAGSGLDAVCIEPAKRQHFEVPKGHPEQVGAAWMRIWSDASLPRRFVTDYERYDANGEIGIHISLK